MSAVPQFLEIPTARRAWSVVRFALCAVLIAYVVTALSWHDQVHLVDGAQGRLLSVSEQEHSTTLRIEDRTITVPNSQVAHIQPGLASLAHRVSLHEAIFATLLTLPVPFLCAYRMYLLLIGLGLNVAKTRATRITLASYVFHLAMPGSTGGDIYRAVMFRKATGSWRPVLVGLVADRVLGLLGLLAWTALASAIWLNHPVFAHLARGILAISLTGFITLFVILRLRLYRAFFELLSKFRKQALIAPEGTMAIGERLLKKRRVLTGAFFLSLISHGLMLASIAVIGLSLDIRFAFEAAGLIIPAASVLATVAPTPQGLGVLEGVLVLVLAPVIAGGANACVLLALGVRFLQAVWAIPGVPLLLLGNTRRASESTPTADT